MSVLSLAGILALGFLVGLAFFVSLWWMTRKLLSGGDTLTILACHLGRLALLGCALVWAARLGLWPLLALVAGITLARVATLRRIRSIAS